MKIKAGDKFTITRHSDGRVFDGTIQDVHGVVLKTYDMFLVDKETQALYPFNSVSGDWFKMHKGMITWQ